MTGFAVIRRWPSMRVTVRDRQPLRIPPGCSVAGRGCGGAPRRQPGREPPHLLERPSIFETGDELADSLLALAAHDVVGVAERLVGAEGHVRAAQDDRHPSGGEEVGEPVGGRRGWPSSRRSRRGRRREGRRGRPVRALHNRCGRRGPSRQSIVADEREPETGQEDAVVDVMASRTGLNQANRKPIVPYAPSG